MRRFLGDAAVAAQTQTEYDRGFENGLVEGFRAARNDLETVSAVDVEFARKRKFLAWSTLALGLGSAVGALVARKDSDLFTVFAVAGGVVTAVVGAAQVLTDESVPGPLGIR